MAYAYSGAGALDYFSCRYGASRLVFRGPHRALEQPFVAFLGGAETYGKLVEDPFPALVERQAGVACVNFGLVNAGVDAFLKDPALPDLARGARAVVVQVMGAQNLTNGFYSVHPRRNDRFVAATARLQALFPKVELTDVHFTRHLVCRLHDTSPRDFAAVVAELKAVWVARMAQLLEAFDCPRLLLWLGPAPPPASATPDLRAEPLLVDAAMLARLRPLVQEVVRVDALRHGVLSSSLGPPMPAPAAHAAIAAAVARGMEPWL